MKELKIKNILSRWWKGILVTGVALLLCGGLINTLRAFLKPDEDVSLAAEQVIIERAPVRDAVEPWADHFALMALFSRVVYRADLDPAERRSRGCDYIHNDDETTYGMPKSAAGRWIRWKGKNACYNEAGLYYETYVYNSAAGLLEEAVIAYRGTENWNVQDVFYDWRANVSALLSLEASQYSLAQSTLPALIAGLKAKNPEIQIYTTGHSLGGGLAQQAIYAAKDIKRAYTFDPSPVTNWSKLRLDDKLQQRDPVIYRAYHRKEALGYLRAITSRLNARRFGRSDYEFHFQESDAIESHNMAILACHFAARIGRGGASHNYTRASAIEQINDGRVCPADIQARLPLLNGSGASGE